MFLNHNRLKCIALRAKNDLSFSNSLTFLFPSSFLVNLTDSHIKYYNAYRQIQLRQESGFIKKLAKDAANEAVKDATGKTINETFDSAMKSIKKGESVVRTTCNSNHDNNSHDKRQNGVDDNENEKTSSRKCMNQRINEGNPKDKETPVVDPRLVGREGTKAVLSGLLGVTEGVMQALKDLFKSILSSKKK